MPTETPTWETTDFKTETPTWESTDFESETPTWDKTTFKSQSLDSKPESKPAGISGPQLTQLGYSLPGKDHPPLDDIGFLTKLGIGPEQMPSAKELMTATGAHPSIAYPLSSVGKLSASVLDWMTKPSGAAQMIAAMVPGLDVVMAGKFAKDMIEGGYVSAKDIGEGLATGDWQKVSDGAVNFLASTYGTKTAIGHGIQTAKAHLDVVKEVIIPGSVEMPAIETKDTAAVIKNLESNNGSLTAAATKGVEDDAIPKQSTTAEVLGGKEAQSNEQLGLRQMGKGNTQSEISSSAQAQEINPMEPVPPPDVQSIKSPSTETLGEPAAPDRIDVLSVGPGGKSVGEPQYAAIAQLTDQLNEVKSESPKEKLRLNEAIAEKWSQGKDVVQSLIGTAKAITESLKSTARGIRKPGELDSILGELDYNLQRSSAESIRARKVMEKAVKDRSIREGAAIYNDAGGDVDAIRETLGNLPEKTKPNVRRALERAANPTPELINFSESLKQFYGIRANDAVMGDIFEKPLEDYFTHIWKKESNMPDSLRAAISNGRVSTYFQFGKKRTIPTFLEGIKAGKTPELDPAKIIPYYNFQLDRAIASREFVRQATEVTLPDERPAVIPSGQGRFLEPDESKAGGTVLVSPSAKGKEFGDYERINHPAMTKWKWATTTPEGANVMVKGDLVVHPAIHTKLSRMMDRSILTPSKTTTALLRVGSEVKAAKLAAIPSLFHQVHVGSHALWHWTKPFGFKERLGFTKDGQIDWESPDTRFAVEKGHLKLAPDPGELNTFSEGIIGRGLTQKIPLIGEWSKAYGEWLFGEYIPKLKLATFENALERNRDWYKGQISDAEIAARVGDSVNNAYGELNHLFLGKNGRSPQFQRLLRGIFLAPDFGEARLRFVEKAFTRFGGEERLALLTAFITMYTAARVGNMMSHGDPETDWKNAFRIKAGDHWWSMRSVIGDVDNAIAESGRFMSARLNPLYSRSLIEFLTKRDWRGIKRTPMEQGQDLVDQLVPIQLGGLTRDDQKVWESFVSSLGLSVRKETPVQDIHRLIGEFKSRSDDPKIKAQWERAQKETSAPSDYQALRNALTNNDFKGAKTAYEELLKTKSEDQISKAMQPGRPFTGSQVLEESFVESLSSAQKRIYDAAVEQQEELADKFENLLNEFNP